jgi:FHS family L-fucose permease-like MFS transporter
MQFMVVAWTYAVAVNFVPSYRDTVDGVGSSTIDLRNTGKDEEFGVVENADKTDEKEAEVETVHIEK